MTKRDILNKIKRTILGEDGTPGITKTKKVQKTDKDFNDDYYKETNKKFKDYLGIKKDDFDAPKVNADEKQASTYGGTGMEGLTPDNEGTQVEKTYTKRVKDLNKPSKDYYLKKDEVNDVYSKLDKKASLYKKQKKVYQNTPPVRAIEAEKVKSEGTIKRLTYKTEFVNESVTFNLIPENFKQNDLIFEMTDGNKTYKIRWEGGVKGRPVVLLFKDKQKINEELNRMYQLFEYNSRDNFSKTNLLKEEEELNNMVKTLRGKDETEPSTSIEKKLSEPKPINLEVRQKGNLFTAAKYVEGSTNIPVAPGNIATYDKDSTRWTINPKFNIEDLKSAITGIMEKNTQSTAIKPALRNELNKSKTMMDKQKFEELLSLGGGA